MVLLPVLSGYFLCPLLSTFSTRTADPAESCQTGLHRPEMGHGRRGARRGWGQQQWWITQGSLEGWWHEYEHVHPCCVPPHHWASLSGALLTQQGGIAASATSTAPPQQVLSHVLLPSTHSGCTPWTSHPSGRADTGGKESSALVGWERNVRELLPFGSKNVASQSHPGFALHEDPWYEGYLQCYLMHGFIREPGITTVDLPISQT